MAGRIDHIIITVNSYDRACQFYGWLMPTVWRPDLHDYGVMRGWTTNAGSFWIKKADPRFAADTLKAASACAKLLSDSRRVCGEFLQRNRSDQRKYP